jgi:protein TonB
MLQDSLFETQRRTKTRKPITVVVSVIAHVGGIAVLVFIPLLQTQALTIPPIDASLFLPRVEKPQAVAVFSAQPQPQRHTQADSSIPIFTTPQTIPDKIAYVDEPPKSDFGFFIVNGGGSRAAFLGNQPIEVNPPVIEPPSPPPPPPIVNAQLYRRGGIVQAANLIYEVKPVYPPIATVTRTQGVVVLEAVINKEGTIESLRVVSGHPLLTQAALDAVKQWKYRPTMLNGEPVDVITTVTVRFTLQ